MTTEQLIEKEYSQFIEYHESMGGFPTTREAFEFGFDYARKILDRPSPWISASERLPETDGFYLFWNSQDNISEEMLFAVGIPPVSVYTHWMPTTPPPIEKGECVENYQP